jgi:hypothetical protein
MRQVPSGASGGRGLKGRIVFLTWKFQETSVARSRIGGKARIGSTVTVVTASVGSLPRSEGKLKRLVDLR